MSCQQPTFPAAGEPCRGPAGGIWVVQHAAFMTATMRRKEGGRWVSFIKITEGGGLVLYLPSRAVNEDYTNCCT